MQQYNFHMTMDISYYYQQYQQGKISEDSLCQAINNLTNETISKADLPVWIEQTICLSNQPVQQSMLYCEQIEEFRFQEPKYWIEQTILLVVKDYFCQDRCQSLIDFWLENNNISLPKQYDTHKNTQDMIDYFLEKLCIPDNRWCDYFQKIYLALYGWSSFINWLTVNPDNPWIKCHANCHDIVLMWLYYEAVIMLEIDQEYQPSDDHLVNQQAVLYRKIAYVWQTAFEIDYVQELLQQLKQQKKPNHQPAKAQFVFCIDTRSERLRRALEKFGYQTYGFAGFFAVAFQFKKANKTCYQSPALIKPNKVLTVSVKHSPIKQLIKQVKEAAKYIKQQFFSPFVLFEAVGLWYAFYMFFKVASPRCAHTISSKTSEDHAEITWDLQAKNQTFDLHEAVEAAASLLTAIGLVENFCSTVIICGHQSDNINNPYKAGLDCGACGGNSGMANAIVIASMLNNLQVRQLLHTKGITIPSETQFIAACHHTVHDRIEMHSSLYPYTIKADIKLACASLRKEKQQSLPGYFSLKRREVEWSELIPELGLANNAAMVIGPRWLTASLNLAGRVFLHSYEPDVDKDGSILTALLNAPAIVAHWINAQYYFSTVEPHLLGAGNKAIHNPLPQIGVMEGNLSDLRVGLPQQSVYFQNNPLHEPRRLLVVVYANPAILSQAMANASDFTHLVKCEWVHFAHIEVS